MDMNGLIGMMIHVSINAVNEAIEGHEGSKKAKKIVFYDSESHGKTRYFVSFPEHSKPEFSYIQKESTRLTEETATRVSQVLTVCGYKDLRIGKAGPTLKVVS